VSCVHAAKTKAFDEATVTGADFRAIRRVRLGG
jgi:hypothetical protein